MRFAVAVLAASATAIAACANTPNNAADGAADRGPPPVEASSPDTSGGDAFVTDGLPADAVATDAPTMDAPTIDAPKIDAAIIDAPAADRVSLDVAQGDAAATDAAARDAAPIDGVGTDAQGAACDGPGARFITDVVAYQFGSGQNFGQDTFPANILGPPSGGGCCAGSVNVVSLGDGGWVAVAFGGNTIVDGPGPDFLVFENPFDVGGDPSNPYAEPGIVAVSQDGTNWVSYPCTATSFPYGTCAGWHPVYADPGVNDIDPTDPATAGGDPFDLADVGLAWARYVRVTDRPGDDLVFDLDAIAIVNASCP